MNDYLDAEHFKEAQEEERLWWGNCANSFHEEEKQFIYAKYMGLEFTRDEHSPYVIRKDGLKILDIGGGSTSLLLKTKGFNRAVLVDPCSYPQWVAQRYVHCGIERLKMTGEDLLYRPTFDEVWMYNCLQHTMDPAKIISNGIEALKPGGVFRIFEWVDTPTNAAHPHSLTSKFLDKQFSALSRIKLSVTELAESGCYGTAYSGVFRVEEENALNLERIAQRFHEAYERFAPDFNYSTREASAVPWNEVPDSNRALMIATVTEVLADLDISPTDHGMCAQLVPVPESELSTWPGPIEGPRWWEVDPNGNPVAGDWLDDAEVRERGYQLPED